MNFPTMNTLASGRFSNETRLRSCIAGALQAAMGTVTHHANAETFKYLRCNSTTAASVGDPENSKPISKVWHVAFDEKASKALYASGGTWSPRESDNWQKCRVNVSPMEIDVSCEAVRSSMFSGFTISRTTGTASQTFGGTTANGDLLAFIERGSCVLVPSDPLSLKGNCSD